MPSDGLIPCQEDFVDLALFVRPGGWDMYTAHVHARYALNRPALGHSKVSRIRADYLCDELGEKPGNARTAMSWRLIAYPLSAIDVPTPEPFDCRELARPPAPR